MSLSPSKAVPVTVAAGNGQFGDTTYTKVFVGGLAWEPQIDTLRAYFQQFVDILEAVVITDKATSRSERYGFVPSKLVGLHLSYGILRGSWRGSHPIPDVWIK